METRGPIVVVGAGIAGLSAALCLAKVGFDVEILERAERIEPVGAGLQLSPNAIRVLARMGVLDGVAESAVSAEAVTLRSGRTGRPIAEVPVSAADGTGYLALHRADLQAALLSAAQADPHVRLRYGLPISGTRTPTGEFAVGAQGEPRSVPWLVVGADGVHSAMASAAGLPPARETGFTALRLMLDAAPADPSIQAWLGPKRHAVAYPVSGGRATNLILLVPGRLAGQVGDAASVAELFAGWDDSLTGMIRDARFTGLWPLLETPHDRGAVHGNLCLIGDAGHAMLPFAAQGAAMAIEDAFVLAREIAFEPDRRMALRRYQNERGPRLQRVRQRVRFHRFVYHLPFPLGAARDVVLASRSQVALRRDLAWLYDWQP